MTPDPARRPRSSVPLAGIRRVDSFCPNGHRLKPAYVRVGDSLEQTCPRDGLKVRSHVERAENGSLTIHREAPR